MHKSALSFTAGCIYSTPRRSLCVLPPTHWTHKYFASVRHRALASASVLLHVRLPVCMSVRASACPSARQCVRPCVCRSGHAGRASAGPVQKYSISHKKVKVPYRTRTALLANLERTSSVPLIVQRTHSSVRYASIQCGTRCGAVQYGAVRRGTAAVICAF